MILYHNCWSELFVLDTILDLIGRPGQRNHSFAFIAEKEAPSVIRLLILMRSQQQFQETISRRKLGWRVRCISMLSFNTFQESSKRIKFYRNRFVFNQVLLPAFDCCEIINRSIDLPLLPDCQIFEKTTFVQSRECQNESSNAFCVVFEHISKEVTCVNYFSVENTKTKTTMLHYFLPSFLREPPNGSEGETPRGPAVPKC